jgi:hypothetical protein
MQILELPRSLDVGEPDDDGPEEVLRGMLHRIRASLLAWMQSLDHLR